MSKKTSSSGYEVGYGKPPPSGQFKPGKSGNPKGRPRATKNLKTDLAEELGEMVVLNENGTPIRLSKQRALVKSLVAKAIKGDSRATGHLLSLYARTLMDSEEPEAATPLAEEDAALLARFAERFLTHSHEKGEHHDDE